MEIRNLLAQVHSDLSNGATFVPKNDAEKGLRSTGDNAFWACNLNEATYDEMDLKMADEALAYVLDYKGDQLFMKSLARVASWDDISPKGVDRAAWIMQKYLTREEQAAGLPDGFGAQSAFQGEIDEQGKLLPKQEIYFRATVAATRLFRNRFKGPGPNGEKQVVTLSDKQGNVFAYFPSTKILDLKVGQELRVKATIKAHTTYEGVKQTVITRATLVPA